jgi:hypothetical protein
MDSNSRSRRERNGPREVAPQANNRRRARADCHQPIGPASPFCNTWHTLSQERDREFESAFLQGRVVCEPACWRSWTRRGRVRSRSPTPAAERMAAHTHVAVGYNVQIAVDAKHKLIVEQQVTNQVVDLGLLAQTAEPAKEVLGVERIH